MNATKEIEMNQEIEVDAMDGSGSESDDSI